MLMRELFTRGIMTMDPQRHVGVFAPGALQHLPAIRARAMESFAWIAGRWNYKNLVPATAANPAYAEAGSQEFVVSPADGWISIPKPLERKCLTFDPMSRQWIYVLTRGAYCMLRSKDGWSEDGTRIVFEGRMTMLGIECDWRMTWIREGPDAFRFVNEEADGSAGDWLYIDEWRFTRAENETGGTS